MSDWEHRKLVIHQKIPFCIGCIVRLDRKFCQFSDLHECWNSYRISIILVEHVCNSLGSCINHGDELERKLHHSVQIAVKDKNDDQS